MVDHRKGTGWVVDRLVELVEKHETGEIICDSAGPAASLLRPLEEAGIVIRDVGAKDHARACGQLFDAVDQGHLRHLGQLELETAIRGAARRPLGDAWAWSRKSSKVDISPLVACTLALLGAGQQPKQRKVVFL